MDWKDCTGSRRESLTKYNAEFGMRNAEFVSELPVSIPHSAFHIPHFGLGGLAESSSPGSPRRAQNRETP